MRDNALSVSLCLLLVARPAIAQDSSATRSARALDTVRVRQVRIEGGYRAVMLRSATRIAEPLRDVPQAVSVVSRAQLTDLAMQSMAEVVRYQAGVGMAQGEGHRDAPVLRGNASTADLFVNGMRDDAQYLRDTYNLDRVEILKGPNALAFGRGGGGGVINRVLREADWSRPRAIVVEGGSFGHARTTLDAGTVLGRLSARASGMLESSSSYRDAVGVERAGVSPSVAWSRGATVARVGGEYFRDRRVTDRGVPSLDGRPLPGVARTFFGDPSWHRAHTTVHALRGAVERAGPGGLQLRSQVQLSTYDKAYQNTVPGAVSADRSSFALSAYRNATARRNLFHQADVVARATTRGVSHVFVAGTELGAQSTGNLRETGYFAGGATTLSVPLATPRTAAPLAFRQSATDADNTARVLVAGAFAQHQATLGSHVQATMGIRWDRFDLRVDNHRNAERRRRVDGLVNPRAALVLKPVPAMSAYGSWSTSALPSAGDQFASLDATSETLAPERFTNREVGLKWDIAPALSLAAAAFRLDRTNTRAPDPQVAGRIVSSGAQRSTGTELSLTGALTGAWEVAASVAWQQAVVTRRTTAAPVGATVPLVPHATMALWQRIAVTPRLALGVGTVRQGRSYAAIDNRVTLPAFTRWDGAIYATLAPQLRLQANVENVLGAAWFATAHSNSNILPGGPRQVRISLATGGGR